MSKTLTCCATNTSIQYGDLVCAARCSLVQGPLLRLRTGTQYSRVDLNASDNSTAVMKSDILQSSAIVLHWCYLVYLYVGRNQGTLRLYASLRFLISKSGGKQIWMPLFMSLACWLQPLSNRNGAIHGCPFKTQPEIMNCCCLQMLYKGFKQRHISLYIHRVSHLEHDKLYYTSLML